MDLFKALADPNLYTGWLTRPHTLQTPCILLTRHDATPVQTQSCSAAEESPLIRLSFSILHQSHRVTHEDHCTAGGNEADLRVSAVAGMPASTVTT